MKAFVLLLTIAFASRFADVESRMTMQQIANGMKSVRKSCMGKSGVAKDVLDDTRNGVYAEDRNLMCYYHCTMNIMKMLDKTGKFNLENTIRQTEAMLPLEFVEPVKAMANRCVLRITSDDECEGAWQYAKCNWETASDAYFFP